MGLTIFPVFPHIQTECGEYLGILCEILLVPQNIVMDLNNVMLTYTQEQIINESMLLVTICLETVSKKLNSSLSL